MRLIIPIGPAGSGKTTLWEEIEINSNPIIRISADRYRYRLYDYNNSFKEIFENKVWQTVWNQFIICLQNKSNIYLDATNLTKTQRMPFIFVARSFGYKVTIILFEIPIVKILQQNNLRERKVPEKIIYEQYFSLELPNKQEYDNFEYITNKFQVWKEK